MTLGLFALGVACLWALFFAALGLRGRRAAVERILAGDEGAASDGAPTIRGQLRRWLALAGFRRTGAPALFVAGCSVAFIAAAAAAWATSAMILDAAVKAVSEIPGGVGEMFGAALETGPAVLFVFIALVPYLVVRATRRRRVDDIERDLPLVLELFATLAGAGLAFDAALNRIIESSRRDRPLIQELRSFQLDLLTGVPRLQALRNLAQRIDTTSTTIFVSATIQAEQIGASITETLRHQADDVRDRRREQALLEAQALPVKLVFPLMACFLPGIFVSTVGPVLFQMVQVVDAIIRPVVK
jgi:Flp pilus assembly protein TadB